LNQSRLPLPTLFKGIAVFTPGGDVIYCIDPDKRSRWHLHLCAALQELLELPEPPHFLVPCYAATIDRWRDPHTGEFKTAAEASPLILRYQILLDVIFEGNFSWEAIVPPVAACDPMVIATHYPQFPQLWEDHDLVVRLDSLNSAPALPAFKPLVASIATRTQPPPSLPPLETTALATKGYVLRLFVSGHSVATERTLQTLHQLLESALPHPYTLKVIDVLKHPDLAEADQVSATPTLVKVWPLPVRRVVGELNEPAIVLRVLGS